MAAAAEAPPLRARARPPAWRQRGAAAPRSLAVVPLAALWLLLLVGAAQAAARGVSPLLRGIADRGRAGEAALASDGDGRVGRTPLSVADERTKATPAPQLLREPDRSKPRPAYITAKPRDCFQIFFVHVEKTGGTTVRRLFEQQARAEGIEYYLQGYLKNGVDMSTPCEGRKGWYAPHCCTWKRLIADLKQNMTSHPRLFVEVRGSRIEKEKAMADLVELRERNGDQCPLVVFTMLREPHRLYTSFYRYFTTEEQYRRSAQFGTTFIDWIPFNMQTEIISGNDVGFKPVFGRNHERVARFMPGRPRAATYEDAASKLDQMDLVGITRGFNAMLLRLSDLTGIGQIQYKVANMQKGKTFEDLAAVNYADLRPHKLKGAPDAPPPEVAREYIQNHTDIDTKLFADYEAKWDAQIAGLGPAFKERLDMYESELLKQRSQRKPSQAWGVAGR